MNNNEIRKSIEELKTQILSFKNAERTTDYVYVSVGGKPYSEKPGEYSDLVTRAMAQDMILAYSVTDDELKKLLKKVYRKLTELNICLLRSVDDYKGRRPLTKVDSKEAVRLIENIFSALRLSLKSKNPKWLNKDLFTAWAERVMYMMIFSYIVTEKNKMRIARLNASIREVDDDGNVLSGLSDIDEKLVNWLCDIRTVALNSLAKIPVTSDASKECLDMAEWHGCIIEAIMQGKTDELIKLAETIK